MTHRYRRRSIVATAAVGVVAAGVLWGLGTDTAAANGTDGQQCTAAQVTATMVRQAWNPGVHDGPRSYGAVQVVARPDEACRLVGAPRASLSGVGLRTASDDGAPRWVLVTPSAPAWIPLDWPDEASPSAQETPRTITLDLPGSPDLVVPWTGGGVDAVGPVAPVAVHDVRTGASPYHYG